MSAVESPLERFAALTPEERAEIIGAEARARGVSPAQVKATLSRSWRFVARPKQLAPPGRWTYWFVMAGRGFGKTLTGAQWTKERALERRCRIGLIAPTRGDVRATMVEGETGLLSVIPNDALFGQSRESAWNKTTLELTLANETILTGFSSERPDRVRGPQHDYVWGEEVSSWNDAKKGPDALDTTFSNMKLGLRLGPHPRAVLTSTPKVNKLTRELAAMAKNGTTLVLVRGSSYENRANLSDIWWEDVVAPLEGTRMGRQEIEAELLEDVEGALWTRSMIEGVRVPVYPELQRLVVSIDPNTTSGEAANDAGIIIAGKGYYDQHGYVLEDRTQTRGGPAAWAQAAVDAYHDWEADTVVAEVNNGGEMVALTIHGVDPTVPVKTVNASRGKRTRAEPVATLYESNPEKELVPKVHHVGAFPDLEDEMCEWTPEGESPNRLDALVWAITELDIWRVVRRAKASSVPTGRIPGVDYR